MPNDALYSEMSEHRLLQAIGRGSSCSTVFIDNTFTIRFVSASVKVLLGHEPASLLGTSGISLVHPDDMEDLAKLIAIEELNPTSFEAAGPGRLTLRPVRLATSDGGWRSLEIAAANFLADPEIDGYLIYVVDAQIRAAELEAYRSLVESTDPVDSLDAIARSISVQLDGAHVLIEADGATNRTSPDMLAALGAAADERPATIQVPVVLDGQVVGSITALDVTGRPFTYWSSELAEVSARLVAKLVLRERAARLLARAANTDALTGLANRHAFNAAVESRQATAKRGAGFIALLYVDLDGFKQVNDRYGHLAGDQVLVVVGERLSEAVRDADVVARVGGDEFCILAAVADADAATRLGDRISAMLSELITVDGQDVTIGATVGIAVAADNSSTGDLVKAADSLVIRMKTQRQDRVSITVVD